MARYMNGKDKDSGGKGRLVMIFLVLVGVGVAYSLFRDSGSDSKCIVFRSHLSIIELYCFLYFGM